MQHIPLSCSKVQAGFPSPAEDYIEAGPSLDKELIPRPASTFFFRVKGQTSENGPILDNDLLIIDRSLLPQSGSLILATIAGSFAIKFYRKKGSRIFLEALGTSDPLLEMNEEKDFQIWGVITHAIHSF